MKAQLKSIFSYDVPDGDLERWVPPKKDFGINVMLFIGWEGENKSDCFNTLLCTPGWFAQYLKKFQVESGQYTILVDAFDYGRLKSYIEAYLERCEGDSWPELARKVDHLASWEFRSDNTHVSPRGISGRAHDI